MICRQSSPSRQFKHTLAERTFQQPAWVVASKWMGRSKQNSFCTSIFINIELIWIELDLGVCAKTVSYVDACCCA